MSGIPNPQYLALLKFGISVPPQQREEVIKLIKTNPSYRDDFESIKNNTKTMYDEEQFLNTISSAHMKIANLSENSKIIQLREHTFQIRAINPDNIRSLTKRAFFNSYDLQRVVLNDLEEQNIYQAQKSRGEDQRKQKEIKRVPEKEGETYKVTKRAEGKTEENDDQEKCICGKAIQESFWIQCSNQTKCRGSSWYHLECTGIKAEPQQVQSIDFICDFCKRLSEEEKESESSPKRFISN